MKTRTIDDDATLTPDDEYVRVHHRQRIRIALGSSSGRNKPVRFKDVAGIAGHHAIELVAESGEDLDGKPAREIGINFGALALMPRDGGWDVLP